MTKRVFVVVWHPSVVEYSKWPGLTAEKLETVLRADERKLNDLDYHATRAFIYSGESATEQLETTLKEPAFDLVMIGGRRSQGRRSLGARIAFNTGPTDSDAAVQLRARAGNAVSGPIGAVPGAAYVAELRLEG